VSANKAYDRISEIRPTGSLVGFINISSILFQIMIVVIFQVITFMYAKGQAWFVPTDPNNPNNIKNSSSMEATSVFLISIYQYVTMAFVFSKGPPYRQPIHSNLLLVIVFIILTTINIWVTVIPPVFVIKFLQMKLLDPKNVFSFFRLNIVGIALLFFVLSILIEVYFFYYLIRKLDIFCVYILILKI
jgi:cation-transporting P-type ATPase 13A2